MLCGAGNLGRAYCTLCPSSLKMSKRSWCGGPNHHLRRLINCPGLIMSHASGLPRDHRISVTIRVFLNRYCQTDWLFGDKARARLIALPIISFQSAWHCCRAVLLLHDKPCKAVSLWRPILSTRKNVWLASSLQSQSEANSNAYHFLTQPHSLGAMGIPWADKWWEGADGLNLFVIVSGTKKSGCQSQICVGHSNPRWRTKWPPVTFLLTISRPLW